ncbi:MAG TPA: aspartate aminotransferase, partial [Alcanivorax sp.]|nr:aspartate aminotransferase [Alcanivorax sp.]
MYEHILWTGQPFVNIVNACPELYDRTVVMNGVSKAYSMTGWRIGYAGGPQKLIAAMKKVQSQSTSNPASISQAAAEAALSGDQQCV